MGRLIKLISIFVLISAGCSDYSLKAYEEPSGAPIEAPNIEVSPSSLNFGTLNADGEVSLKTITIKNKGSTTLNIVSADLSNTSTVYTLSNLSDDELEPDEEAYIIVMYNPETHSTDNNSVVIVSDDPEDSLVSVSLVGDSEAPVISIEPDSYDFENVLVGCDDDLNVTVSNIGNVDLTIDQINYYVTYPADFAIEEYEDTYGPLPWTLEPGDSVILEVKYYPTDVDLDSGIIEVYSDDPYTPIAEATQEAEGIYSSTYEESHEQEEVDAVDILFVIDNSCSMNDKQTQLANNFDTFMNVFDISGIDYHIGFITTDDSDIQGSLITTSTADPVAEVAQIIDDIGTHGSATERGLHYSYYALQAGYDFGPGSDFWRDESKLIIIYISDEDDSSTGITPTSIKSYTIAAKAGADYVAAHAVAGDVPGGCNTNGGATEGLEYYTVVSYLNGTFLSICQDDWGTPLEILANESILKSSFTLDKEPVEETITVVVNGMEESDWTYDSSDNTISFGNGSVPAAGASILISYSPISDCSEDTGV
jgi:hypothetical protein